MTDKEYQQLMEVADKHHERVKKFTKEEAVQFLVDVGILDRNGNHTEPYKNLGRVVKNLNSM